MLDDTNRKRIIDAIALLEQVLRETDNTVRSSEMLRAIETARTAQGGTSALSSVEGGGEDYGRERIDYQKKL